MSGSLMTLNTTITQQPLSPENRLLVIFDYLNTKTNFSVQIDRKQRPFFTTLEFKWQVLGINNIAMKTNSN